MPKEKKKNKPPYTYDQQTRAQQSTASTGTSQLSSSPTYLRQANPTSQQTKCDFSSLAASEDEKGARHANSII